MQIQNTYGLFPRIIGKGDIAHRLMELLLRMRSEAAAEDKDASRYGLMPSAHIESLVIIDREIDLATPLFTQLTYEGLIDETFGIQYNAAEIDTSIVGAAPGASNTGKAPSAPTQQGAQTESSARFIGQTLRPTSRYKFCNSRQFAEQSRPKVAKRYGEPAYS